VLSALIVGLSGESLTAEEAAFLRDVRPCGIILFARNLSTHDQIRRLCADARAAAGDDNILVLIDQEGGRVQRLRPPLGRALPKAATLGRAYQSDAPRAVQLANQIARLLAADLRSLGINTNCAPVLDLPVPGAHDIIGDRAYGTTSDLVIALGRAVASGFMAGGVVPVVKHIPGHGRADLDSHHDLPVVDASLDVLVKTDFVPFAALSLAPDAPPAAMTAHVVFSALDPDQPASTSALVHRDVIRGGLGFDGLLMSDDLSMKALRGEMGARARAVLAAGSDVVLHCNGDLAEMREAAAAAPALSGRSLDRYEVARTVFTREQPFDVPAAEAALDLAMALDRGAIESI